MEVVVILQDTGFLGTAEDYIKQYYGKTFEELNLNEAEMIVANLKEKKGCLVGTKEGGYK
jgi:hypothetical protein